MGGPGGNTDLSHPQDSNVPQKYEGDVFTVKCEFHLKDTPMTVANGFVRLRRYDSQDYLQFKAPGSVPADASMNKWKLNAPANGSTVYSMDIDPMTLDLGWYHIEFYGEVSVGAGKTMLRVDGAFEVVSLSRYDRIANRVRNQLADQDIEDYIEAAGPYTKFRGQTILAFIRDGLDWINATGPRADFFTMDTLPNEYDWYLQQYAWAMCMLAKARNFIDNDLQVSDAHSLIQAKYEKYRGMYDMIYKNALDALISYKKATLGQMAGAVGMRRRKYPLIFYYRGLATTSANYWSGAYVWSY